MKKMFALILIGCLCIGLCACGKQPQENGSGENVSELEETVQLEQVGADVLFDPNANVAAIQMHIGKEATIIGKISGIDVNFCTMDVVHSLEKTVTVEMETKDLANMNVGEIHVVTGVISSAGDDGYTLTAASLADQAKKNEYILAFTENIVSKGDVVTDFQKLRMDILLEFITNDTSEFLISSESEVEEYISGNWYAWSVLNGDCRYTDKITINAEDNSLKLANPGNYSTVRYDITQFMIDETASLDASYTCTVDFDNKAFYTSTGKVYQLSREYCIVKSDCRETYYIESGYTLIPQRSNWDMWYILERAV